MIGDFAVVWGERNLLLAGLANTVALSVLAGAAALVLGALLSTALMARARPVRAAATTFVDAMRCIPFLLYAYVIYYGLPSLGLVLDNWSAGLAALATYHAAYMAEILRGVWSVHPREQIEAAHAFGFTGFRMFRRLILPPLILAAGPILGNALIIIIKDSAFLTVIALPELTHAASSIQSRRYVPFAAFISAVLLYWALCLLVEAGIGAIGRLAEVRR